MMSITGWVGNKGKALVPAKWRKGISDRISIKDKDDDSYTLDFPNNEVRQSFSKLILNIQYAVANRDILAVKSGLRKALEAQDVDKIVEQFKIIYSSVPHNHFDSNKTEHFYSAVLLMYLQASGFDASAERLSNKGWAGTQAKLLFLRSGAMDGDRRRNRDV